MTPVILEMLSTDPEARPSMRAVADSLARLAAASRSRGIAKHSLCLRQPRRLLAMPSMWTYRRTILRQHQRLVRFRRQRPRTWIRIRPNPRASTASGRRGHCCRHRHWSPDRCADGRRGWSPAASSGKSGAAAPESQACRRRRRLPEPPRSLSGHRRHQPREPVPVRQPGMRPRQLPHEPRLLGHPSVSQQRPHRRFGGCRRQRSSGGITTYYALMPRQHRRRLATDDGLVSNQPCWRAPGLPAVLGCDRQGFGSGCERHPAKFCAGNDHLLLQGRGRVRGGRRTAWSMRGGRLARHSSSTTRSKNQ